MIMKMIQNLRKRMEKMQEMFIKDIEELKNNNNNKKKHEQYSRSNQ